MWRHLFSRSPLPADGVRLTLPDGTPMLARPIRPDDAPRFVAGYEKLSERSRRLRFFGQVSSLSSRQLDFLTAPDGRKPIQRIFAQYELVVRQSAPALP